MGIGRMLDHENRQKQSRVGAVTDEIKDRFGTVAIQRASNYESRGQATVGARPSRLADDWHLPAK